MASSPQPVPISNSAKSPSQEVNGLSSSYNSTCSSRWKRSSPDPNKMMMGRSPNVIDSNVKRNILSSSSSRRNSHMSERVGSPSLSGYPVRFVRNLNFSINHSSTPLLGRSSWFIRLSQFARQKWHFSA